MSEFLYRLRDVDGSLLYVGITTNWPTRMAQHQADKPWWSEVSTVELVRLECTRPQVEAIEKAVIKTEAPRYNVAHNGEVRVQLGARAKRNPLRESRQGEPRPMTPEERHQIILKYSGFGPEWHHWSARGYQEGWVVEHPHYGEGLVQQCDDDPIHGDVRIKFWDDNDFPAYRCLSIHWAPLRTVAK